MIKNYKNKKLKKATKIPTKMLIKPEKEKIKSRVNLKERVEDNVCDLSLSALNEVPVRGIASYKRVTVLDLSSNNLTFLSRNFCLMLTRLTRLNLSRNQLNSLPDEIGALVNLQYLDLYENNLEYLPLTFATLVSLDYLDLKGNPLSPGIAQIVGANMTTKDCQDAARNVVCFMARIQSESEEYINNAADFIWKQEDEGLEFMEKEEQLEKMLVIPIPRNKKRNRNKNKKKAAEQITASVTKDKFTDILSTTTTITTSNKQANAQLRSNASLNHTSNMSTRKGQRARKKIGWLQYIQRRFIKHYISSTVIRSIITFFILLAINIFVIYMIMFKNPELIEKILEAIPQQYRDWIIAKTEIFRVNIGDWIADFLTPPDEQ